jgi:hypothetical protein
VRPEHAPSTKLGHFPNPVEFTSQNLAYRARFESHFTVAGRELSPYTNLRPIWRIGDWSSESNTRPFSGFEVQSPTIRRLGITLSAVSLSCIARTIPWTRRGCALVARGLYAHVPPAHGDCPLSDKAPNQAISKLSSSIVCVIAYLVAARRIDLQAQP